MAALGLAVTLHPPVTLKVKLYWWGGFVSLTLVGLVIAILQQRQQELIDAKQTQSNNAMVEEIKSANAKLDKLASAKGIVIPGGLNEKLDSLINDFSSIKNRVEALPRPEITNVTVQSLNVQQTEPFSFVVNYETKVEIQIMNANEKTGFKILCPHLVSQPTITATGSGMAFGSAFTVPTTSSEVTLITSDPIQKSDIQISVVDQSEMQGAGH